MRALLAKPKQGQGDGPLAFTRIHTLLVQKDIEFCLILFSSHAPGSPATSSSQGWFAKARGARGAL